MQTTIYYRKEDEFLIDKVEEKANRERKSKSAVILSILEEYFEAERRIGEILKDMGAVEPEKIDEALSKQKEESDKKIGEIMVENDYIREVDLDRALQVQNK
ncbi:MAG: hypothetical protein ACLFN7_05430 [Candidatus Acetothermia bacterium]